MKKFLLALGILAVSFTNVFAQKVVLAQDVTKDTIQIKFGPNKKYFGHIYVGYGFAAGAAESKSSAINYGSSHEWLFGYRFKYKIANVYALGFDATLNPVTYYMKQKEGKTLPTMFLFDKEKFKFTNLGLSVYQRINWDKRGNYVGNFIDMGVYGNWMPVRVHIYEYDAPANAGFKEVKVRETGLKYIEDLNYGALARIGFNRYVFYCSYRLSELVKPGAGIRNSDGVVVSPYADLPKFMVGLQLSMHK